MRKLFLNTKEQTQPCLLFFRRRSLLSRFLDSHRAIGLLCFGFLGLGLRSGAFARLLSSSALAARGGNGGGGRQLAFIGGDGLLVGGDHRHTGAQGFIEIAGHTNVEHNVAVLGTAEQLAVSLAFGVQELSDALELGFADGAGGRGNFLFA